MTHEEEALDLYRKIVEREGLGLEDTLAAALFCNLRFERSAHSYDHADDARLCLSRAEIFVEEREAWKKARQHMAALEGTTEARR